MPESEVIEAIRSVFILDRERTMYQDLPFGIRQPVDIAVKALPPSINDPTTAEHALSSIGDTVVEIVTRSFPPRLRVLDREGRDPVHVTLRVLKVIGAAGSHAAGKRVAAYHRQIDDIAWFVDEGQFAPHDRAALLDCIRSTHSQVSSNEAIAVPLARS